LEHFDTIYNSPSQIYHFALPFCPSSSWLQKCYGPELSHEVKVVKGTEGGWGRCSRTTLLGSIVWALSYQNGNIAIGSESRDIIILDIITGSQTAVLSGHTDDVICVTFSSDGKSLVSGSSDKTVKLWDVQTGGVVKTFCGHTYRVWAVSISTDCTMIASGSQDKTLCLWDIQTGKCLHTIKQQDIVWDVSFSPIDPQHLISISDGKVWWWDANGHHLPPTYDGFHISFSPDHTLFALCCGNVVTVQNSGSKAIVAQFHVVNIAEYCCFSPDGRFIAAAAMNTAYVWDIASSDPHLVETFFGHTDSITSLVFSSPSSLISASQDRSVKFWKIGPLSKDQVGTDPGSTPIALPSIQSVSLQARAGIAISSDSDGVVKTWDLFTGFCKATFQIPAAKDINDGDGDAKLIDGRLIFAWYENKNIRIWDIEKGELLKTLGTSGMSSCRGLRISGDGSKVLYLYENAIQAWCMWTWEPVGDVKLGLEVPYLDSLITNDSRVWTHSQNSSAQEGWDFVVSGTSPVSFDPSTGRPHLDFIGGSTWQTHAPSWIKIKDAVTGKEVFQLSGRYAKPRDVQWDGRYLVAGYQFGEVLILDFNHLLPQ